MVQLVRSAHDRAVYFTLISGICGKIAKLKVCKPGTFTAKANLQQPQLPFPGNYIGGGEDPYFDEMDGLNRHRRRTTPQQNHKDIRIEEEQQLPQHPRDNNILSSIASEI